MKALHWMAAIFLVVLAGLAAAETIDYVTYYPTSTQGGGGGGGGATGNLQVRSLTVGDAYKAVNMNGANRDGAAYILNELGLGTVTPAGSLHVTGEDDVVSQVLFRPGADTPAGQPSRMRFGLGTAAPADLMHVVGGDDLQENVVLVPGANTAAAGVPRIRLGLGTTAPQGPLHVVGQNDGWENVLFMPGNDTAAAGAPLMQMAVGAPGGNINGDPYPLFVRRDQPSGTMVILENQNATAWSSAQYGVATDTGFIGYMGAMNSNHTLVQYRDKFVIASRLGKDLVLSAEEMAATSNILFYTQLTGGNNNNPAVEKMRITNAGNIGIGTAAPVGRFHVQGPRDAAGRALFMPGAGGTIRVGISNTAPSETLEVTPGAGRASMLIMDNGPTPLLRMVDTYGGSFNDRGFQIQASFNSLRFGSVLDSPNGGWRVPDILILNHNGNVGIRLGNPPIPAFKLHVNGSASKTGGGSWTNPSSDGRLKKNIRRIPDALEKITSLRGVQFNWIHPEQHKGEPGAGFLGQEMEKLFPDWVEEVPAYGPDAGLLPEGKMKAVALPTAFNAYVVEAIRELKERNERLEKECDELERELQRLKG